MPQNALVIYKSSAGSGKTYTLVLEYLRLVLLNPSQYRSVLAVTFTNKATGEMKSRIIESLVEISENKNEKLQKAVADGSGLPVSILPERAGQVLGNLLHDYSGFAVSTIDSFFSMLLRALARELNLNLRFDLELNTPAVIREITARMLQDTGTNQWLREWLEEFILERLDQEQGWKIVGDIHTMAKELFTESYREKFSGGHNKPDREFAKELRSIVSRFEHEMKETGNAALDSIHKAGLIKDDFSYKGVGTYTYFEKITEATKAEHYLPGKRLQEFADDENKWIPKKSENKDQLLSLVQTTLVPLSRKIMDFMETEFAAYISAKRVLNTLHLAGIYSLLDEKLQEFREENNLVLISDTNRMLMKAVHGDDSSFLYEKSGNRYSHFMLDEFQDTSDFQWRNLLPLINNALGSGHYTMLVGDAKQSIYRWRGGNMELLLSGVQKQLNHFRELTHTKTLADNYRSREQVVQFNNSFFEIAPKLLLPGKENEMLRNAYEPGDLKQNWKKGNPGEGYVNMRFIPNKETENENGESESWKIRACKVNLEIVNKILEAGFDFGDIVFLTRKNEDAKVITKFLIENGIHRIISPESMQLHHSAKIQFLINLLTFIDDSSNDVVLTQLVYYWHKIHQNNETYSVHQLLSQSRKTKLSILPTEYTGQLHSLRQTPLYEAVERLTTIFSLGTQPEAYLQRFLDVILEYSSKKPANITDFLEWWEENKDGDDCSVIIPSGENAIRVMSIHKSKGLQFPVVIVPFANWDLKPKSNSVMWVKSEVPPFNKYSYHPVKIASELELSLFREDYLEEVRKTYCDNINMLYVAFTRAEEQLYVVAPTLSEKQKKNPDAEFSKVQDLIVATLKASPQLAATLSGNDEFFETGKFLPPLKVKSTTKSGTRLEQWHSVPWQSRLQMIINRNKISYLDPEPPETRYGTLFHKMVSEIFTKVDAEVFVKTHAEGITIDPETQQRLINDIGIFLGQATIHNWFPEGAEIVNEAELLLPDGTILRPDRLVLHDGKAVVIDYKTGSEEKHHSAQVQQYAMVLRQMGISETKMFLVYLSENKVVEVAA